MSFYNKFLRYIYVLPAVKYFSIICEDCDNSEPAENPERKDVTVDSFKPSTAKLFFNFKNSSNIFNLAIFLTFHDFKNLICQVLKIEVKIYMTLKKIVI